MVSTVTPTVLAAMADGNMRTALSVTVVLAVIAFLAARELGLATGGRLRRLGRDLPLVITPLLFNFVDVVLSRLVTIH